MTEPYASDLPPARIGDDDKTLPIVVYVLYILGWAGGLTALIGFVMAYALKGAAAPWAKTHYVFAIRTAWIALIGWVLVGLLCVLALPLFLVMVGFLVWWFAITLGSLIGVWVTVRCIVGLVYAARSEPYPRPSAWII